MGSSRPAIPILAIILATGSLVLGAITFTSVSRIDSQVSDYFDQNSWYNYNGSTFSSDPIYTYLTFTSLTVEFDLGQNESVYFSFICRAHIEGNPITWSRITVHFRVDGLYQTEPSAQVGMYQGTFTNNYMVHLQAVRSDLLAGEHNVTVVIYGDSAANYIWKSSLFVQKV